MCVESALGGRTGAANPPVGVPSSERKSCCRAIYIYIHVFGAVWQRIAITPAQSFLYTIAHLTGSRPAPQRPSYSHNSSHYIMFLVDN